jgi:polyisoprenyl-phosphate glycosyltransferase
MPSPVRPRLSLVIPVFNEEAVIPELLQRLRALLEPLPQWEVLFVDDGSADRSRDLLAQACAAEPRFVLLELSRNFGHQLAISAGMDHALGDAVVILDADLQDPPEVVLEMLRLFDQGYDVVYGVRRRRDGESSFKRLTAALFYRLLRRVAGVDIPADVGDFRLMSRRVVQALVGLREANRFVRGLVAWIGFRQTAVYYDRAPRFAGETHYPLRKMLRFAVDGIVSFSALPLRIATALGVLVGLAAFGVAAWVIYVKLTGAFVVPGWATLMLAVSLASSVQLLVIGILGEYLGRIYDEVKRRPLYIVQQTHNLERQDERPLSQFGAPPQNGRAGGPAR